MRVNTNPIVRKATPNVWRKGIFTDQVEVLSLVKDPAREHRSGWISYHDHIIDSPEVEIVCGGLNVKDLQGAALWRQGHLFHFAFDLTPSEMNDTGQALLLNAIAYIARFNEDRPIARTPSGWSEKQDAPRLRRWIENLFANGRPEKRELDFYLSPEIATLVSRMKAETYAQWLKENRDFLTCDTDGKLMVDAVAKELRIHFDHADFFSKVIEVLRTPATIKKAQGLLKRYAPDGPASASADEWTQWWQANQPYLFFSIKGGYRWYLDPLAKKRGIASDQLRGDKRASD